MHTSTPSRPRRGRRRSFHGEQPRRNNNDRRNNGRRSFGDRKPSGRKNGGRKQPTFDPSQFINQNPVEMAPETFTPTHTFGQFGLDSRIVRTVADLNISAPTPIQDQIIPQIMAGRDVIGLAQTGTGKTAAFLLPLIHKTTKNWKRQTLIMTPTRELAIQVEAELQKLSKGFKLFSTTLVGGTNIGPQIRDLRRQNHFIIGTPGRILDLINRGNLKTGQVTTVVLDEADRMLDMGFIHDMRKILSGVPKERETLFFSATMTDEAKRIVGDFMHDPAVVSVKKKDVIDSIEQDVVRYEHAHKYDTLLNLFADDKLKRVIIFGSMKHSVEKLAKELCRSGVNAESIHGNKSHSQRQRSLKRFKEGQARVLVATDVAARGIHVDNVSHVINYDLPQTFEDYVHRIGRTGRAHERGKALTFVSGPLAA